MLIAMIFLFLLLMGVPIVFVLGISGSVSILQADLPLVLIPQRMFVGLNSFLLISVPLFILAGNLMDACGITSRIVDFSNMLIGRIRGGLSYVTLVAMDFSSGITGAGAADTAAIGSVMIPVMVKEGYSPEYAAGLTAVGATVGPIIPPSIAFVIYGAMTEVSIAHLFLAGFIPGFMFTLALMAVARYYAVKQNHPIRVIEITWRGFFRSFVEAIPALMMPLLILGGILTGVFTPTEAAGAGVFYSLVVGFLIYRELKLERLWPILKETAIMSGGIMLLVANASLFSWILTAEGIPQKVAEGIRYLTQNPYVVLFWINLLLLFMGCIMETLATIIILVPVLLPLIKSLGIDPLHFGVVMVVNLSIGLATPPVGVNLFVASSIAKIPLERISKSIWLFLVALLVPLALITYIPQITLWVPQLFLK
jgi:tripartite ATP-independent transporter DctM subunit